MDYRIYNLIGSKKYRRELRSHLTPAEAKLWNHLKNRQLLGKKFRRQAGIGNYIVDFYCPEKHLAVELDGSPHDTEQGYLKDQERTRLLEGKGIKLIRFENKDILNNTQGVLEEIKKYLV